MGKKMNTVTLFEDSDGQLYFDLDTQTLNQLGWAEGETLVWEIDSDSKTAKVYKND
jgi:hypothetical protein